MMLQLRRKPFIKVVWTCVSTFYSILLLSIGPWKLKSFPFLKSKALLKLCHSSQFLLSLSFSLSFTLQRQHQHQQQQQQQQHTEQIRKIGDQPLRDKLKLLGGWPVIEDKWKAPVNMSIEKLMGTLRGDYSEPVLIELYVGADDKNSSINILQVSKEARR